MHMTPTSVAACTCWHNNKVVVQYWESEHVRRFYSDTISHSVSLLPLLHYIQALLSCFSCCWSHTLSFGLCSSSFICSYLQLSFIVVLSYFFYYSSLYTQGWNLQAGIIPLCLGLGMKISTSACPVSVASAEHMNMNTCLVPLILLATKNL